MSSERYFYSVDFWQTYMFDGEPGDRWYEKHTDVYACAEYVISRESDEEDLRGHIEEIDALMNLPHEAERRRELGQQLNDIDDEPGAFDAFLRDFRARCERQLAGDLSQPLVDPRGPRKRRGGPPLSPQGYDISLPSAGSFASQEVAEAVVEAVLKAYGDRIRRSFARSTSGVTRRLPPMRMRFDKEVGLVAVRDGQDHRTRRAVVLLHDVEGEPLVFNSFPMEEVPDPPQFEALSVLFGGWLHADWVDEFPADARDPVEQVRRFAANEPRETVKQAAAQLEALRSSGTEDDRRQAVRGLCSYFLPRPPGQLDRFLEEAAQVLSS